MGFSVSGATAVIVVGLLISAATLYPAVDRFTERRAESMNAQQERTLNQMNTEIEAVNATYNDSSDRVEVIVRNTGVSTLAVPAVDLLVDGEYAVPAETTMTVTNGTGTDLWAPGDVLTTATDAASAPDRIKVVTGPGVAVTSDVTVI